MKEDTKKAVVNEIPCCDPASSCCGDTNEALKAADEIRKTVRNGYAKVAMRGSSCCADTDSCCETSDAAQDISKKLGYSEEELESIPQGANLGLGCGNPIALASLKEGETVLDLGSGAGVDCFIAANKVGKSGKVIGVDMTPEMIGKARENARRGNYENVEFRLGEIGNLPVADNSVDVVISNCVINLVPDKRRAFAETFRALKPSGRLMVSDMVLLKELPDAVRNSADAYVSCIAGAVLKDEYIESIKAAGFSDVKVMDETSSSADCVTNDPVVQEAAENLCLSSEEVEEAAVSVASIKVAGIKPSV